MNPMRLTFASLTLCLATAGCGDDGGDASGTGTETLTSSTTSSDSNTTSTSGTGTSGTSGTSMGVTTDDSTGGTSDATTGGMLACPYTEIGGATPTVDMELVASGFNRPVLVVGHPTEPESLFVVEQAGNVKLLGPGETTAPADNFLSVAVTGAGNATIGDERGLLGFALHPDYPTDPRVYIAHNPENGEGSPPTVVDEYTEENGTATFTRTIIEADQPAGNHNGGMIAFGSDGYLYISLGDGGDADDNFNTGRNPAQILAKILRIGVEPDQEPDNVVACDTCQTRGPFDYTIPADNPFVDNAAFAPEVWAWGFRNPWRFYFDPADGSTMYVGDVGQGQREEIALVAAGEDHGWSDMEGTICFEGSGCDDTVNPGEVNSDGLTLPIADYDRQNFRCSVTGLGVYRSCEVPALDGFFFYGDYCNGQVFAVFTDGTMISGGSEVFDFNGELPIGGGNNAYGDVFVTVAVAPGPGDVFTDGRVYRVTAQ